MVALLFAAATAFVPVLVPGDAVPATRLVDQLGRPFAFGDLRGRTLVVAFGYTHCNDADACPLVAAKLAKVQSLVARDPVAIVELTVDPLRDTPAALRAYGRAFGTNPARWRFATGERDAVLALDRRLGAVVEPPAADGTIVHSELALVVDAQGRIADRLAGDDWTPQELAARARAVAGRPSNAFENVLLALSRGIEAACGGGKSGVTLGLAIAIFLGLVAAFGYAALRMLGIQSPKIAPQSSTQSPSAPSK